MATGCDGALMAAFLPDKNWVRAHTGLPLAIAHRGASAYAFDNTLRAFQVAHELGADMWEVDIRLTRDGVPVAFHDANLNMGAGNIHPLSEISSQELFAVTAAAGRPAPAFEEVARLAAALGTGIYLDAKEGDAAALAIEILKAQRIGKVIAGANTPEDCKSLKAAGCPYPVSLLVGCGQDPFPLAQACGAEIVHPCWEKASARPDRLLDAAFFRQAEVLGLPVVTWHEERAEVLSELVRMPLLGICSDQPEMIARYRYEDAALPEMVCHRGACRIAPENTLASARAAWDAGFAYVEIDVRETADGHLVVHHDAQLERTTSGGGALGKQTLAALKHLDAGHSFDAFFAGEGLPELGEVLALAVEKGGKLYVELKQADPVRTAHTVLDRLPSDSVFFWSFDQTLLRDIRAAIPEARLMVRPEDYGSLEACLTAFDADIVEFNASNAGEEAIAAVRAAGRQVMIAYMGDAPDVILKLAGLQPDLFNVNAPFLVRRLSAQASERPSSHA